MSKNKKKPQEAAEQPLCRVNRKFIRNLIADSSINVSGGSNLFYYMTLCSYANFAASERYVGDIKYIADTGEWICRIDEMSRWFRTGTLWQVLHILDRLCEQQLISYRRLGSERQYIKFAVTDWRRLNDIPETSEETESDVPRIKDPGYFYISAEKAAKLMTAERCSEMDIMLDLWINTGYDSARAGDDAEEIGKSDSKTNEKR